MKQIESNTTHTGTHTRKIGLIDVDGHNYPNIALMRLASWHKEQGDIVEWAMPIFGNYDTIYASKIFTFTKDFNRYEYYAKQFIYGGTGYNIKSQLPDHIERHNKLAYDLYPNCDFSIQIYSRGCIRRCPFCLVFQKEGKIRPVEPLEWNPKGKSIEVLDNNFFANPYWKDAISHLKEKKQAIKFHGVDIRIMTEEQAKALNSLNLNGRVHIAWDLPNVDLKEKLKAITEIIKPWKIVCYVLIGYNSTKDEDLYRLRTLKQLGITPFVQPYRDYSNIRTPTQYEKDIARWANNHFIFKKIDFLDYAPRLNFKCSKYFE